MTLILGLHLGSWSMVAADTREVRFNPPDFEPEIGNDACKKVAQTLDGLIAGSGILQVVYPINEWLGREAVDDTDSIVSEMKRVADVVIGGMPDVGELKKAAQRTGSVRSSPRGREVKLEMFQSDQGYWPLDINVGFPITLLPVDTTLADFEPSLYALKAKLRPERGLKNLNASLEYHLGLVAKFMREATTISSVLSDSIQVGYHTRDREVEVMDIMPLSDFE